jgi:hypothetical protein
MSLRSVIAASAGTTKAVSPIGELFLCVLDLAFERGGHVRDKDETVVVDVSTSY